MKVSFFTTIFHTLSLSRENTKFLDGTLIAIIDNDVIEQLRQMIYKFITSFYVDRKI